MKRDDRAVQLRHHLGARIRALRGARGLTQETIADRLEVTPKYVSQLECGLRSPSWETVVAIAHHGFDINVAALMFGIDEQTVMTREELLSRLSKLRSPQFEQVLYLLRVPDEYLPASTAAQALRAVELMRYIEQQNQLGQLARIVRQVVADSGQVGPDSRYPRPRRRSGRNTLRRMR